MSKGGRLLFWGAAVVASAFGVGFSFYVGCRTRRMAKRKFGSKKGIFPPVTIFRPIKEGAPDMVRNLGRLIKSCRPNDQVIVGVGSESLCRELVAQVGSRDSVSVEFVVCKAGLHRNPKVNKLAQMEAFGRHDLYICTDSETRISADFLDQFREEWERRGAAAISSPYQIHPTRGIWARLDHAASFFTFWPGCLLLAERGSVDFMLGACMGIRKGALHAVGGWSAMGDYLAEDHRAGKEIASWGGRVVLSEAVVEMSGERMTFGDWVLHQHRVFRTHRLLAPMGYLGLPLTYGTALFGWAAIGRPTRLKWLLFIALGWIQAWGAKGSLRALARQGKPVRVPFWALLVAALLEPGYWVSGWLPIPVRWAGRWIKCGRATKIPGRQ